METIFQLSQAEYRALKSEGLALEVGGARFQIRVQARVKRQPVIPKVKAVPKRRRTFTSAYKKRVAKFAQGTSPGRASREFGIARSVVARWVTEQAA